MKSIFVGIKGYILAGVVAVAMVGGFTLWNYDGNVVVNDNGNVKIMDVSLVESMQFFNDTKNEKFKIKDKEYELVPNTPIVIDKKISLNKNEVKIQSLTDTDYLYHNKTDKKDPIVYKTSRKDTVKVDKSQEVYLTYVDDKTVFIVNDITIDGKTYSSSIYNIESQTITAKNGILKLGKDAKISVNGSLDKSLTVKELNDKVVAYEKIYRSLPPVKVESKKEAKKDTEVKTPEVAVTPATNDGKTADTNVKSNSNPKTTSSTSSNGGSANGNNNNGNNNNNGGGSNVVPPKPDEVVKKEPSINSFNAVVNDTTSSVDLTFGYDKNDYNVDKINILMDNKVIDTVTPDTTSYSIAKKYGQHQYAVQLVYSKGTINSNVISRDLSYDVSYTSNAINTTKNQIDVNSLTIRGRAVGKIESGSVVLKDEKGKQINTIALTSDQIIELNNGILNTPVSFTGLKTNTKYQISLELFMAGNTKVEINEQTAMVVATDLNEPKLNKVTLDKKIYDKNTTAKVVLDFDNTDKANLITVNYKINGNLQSASIQNTNGTYGFEFITGANKSSAIDAEKFEVVSFSYDKSATDGLQEATVNTSLASEYTINQELANNAKVETLDVFPDEFSTQVYYDDVDSVVVPGTMLLQIKDKSDNSVVTKTITATSGTIVNTGVINNLKPDHSYEVSLIADLKTYAKDYPKYVLATTTVKTVMNPDKTVTVDAINTTKSENEITIAGGSFTGIGLSLIDTGIVTLTEGGNVTDMPLSVDQINQIKAGALTSPITFTGLKNNTKYSVNFKFVGPSSKIWVIDSALEPITTNVKTPTIKSIATDATTYKKDDVAKVNIVLNENLDNATITRIKVGTEYKNVKETSKNNYSYDLPVGTIPGETTLALEELCFDSNVESGIQESCIKTTLTTKYNVLKEIPKAVISNVNGKLDQSSFDFNITDPDNAINRTSIKFDVYDNTNKLVTTTNNYNATSTLPQNIVISGLLPNIKYNVKVSGQYDILDGKAATVQELIAFNAMTQVPTDASLDAITYTSLADSITLKDLKVSGPAVGFVKSGKITASNGAANQTHTLTADEIKALNLGIISTDIVFDKLKSNQEYTFQVELVNLKDEAINLAVKAQTKVFTNFIAPKVDKIFLDDKLVNKGLNQLGTLKLSENKDKVEILEIEIDGKKVVPVKVDDLTYRFDYVTSATSSNAVDDKNIKLTEVSYDKSPVTGLQKETIKDIKDFKYTVVKELPVVKSSNVIIGTRDITFDLNITDVDDAFTKDMGQISVVDGAGKAVGTVTGYDKNSKAQTIKVSGLQDNTSYTLKYVDEYNLLDGNGLQKDQEIINYKFNSDIDLSMNLTAMNTTKTDDAITVVDATFGGTGINNVVSGSLVVENAKGKKTVALTDAQVNEVKAGKLVTPVSIGSLTSDTTYKVSFEFVAVNSAFMTLDDQALVSVKTNNAQPSVKAITVDKVNYDKNATATVTITLDKNSNNAVITKAKVNGADVVVNDKGSLTATYTFNVGTDAKEFTLNLEGLCYDGSSEAGIQEVCLTTNLTTKYNVILAKPTAVINNFTTTYNSMLFDLTITDADASLIKDHGAIVVTDKAGKVVGTVKTFDLNTGTQKVEIENLPENTELDVKYVDSYDILDNAPQTDIELAKGTTKTQPNLNVNIDGITGSRTIDTMTLTSVKASDVGIKNIKNADVKVTSGSSNSTVALTTQQVNELKAGEIKTPILINGLNSDTEYSITIAGTGINNQPLVVTDKVTYKDITDKKAPIVNKLSGDKVHYAKNSDANFTLNMSSNNDDATITKVISDGKEVVFTPSDKLNVKYTKNVGKVLGDFNEKVESICYDANRQAGIQEKCLTGLTTTTMYNLIAEVGTVAVNNVKVDETATEATITITDPDKVIDNKTLKLEVLDDKSNKVTVTSNFNPNGTFPQNIKVDGLKGGKQYTIKVIGDYDILDGNGKVTKDLTTSSFTTLNPTNLEVINYKFTADSKSITIDEAIFQGEALKYVKAGEAVISQGANTSKVTLTPTQITEINNGKLVTDLTFNGLNTNTEYTVVLELKTLDDRNIKLVNKADNTFFTNKEAPEFDSISLAKNAFTKGEKTTGTINLKTNKDKAVPSKVSINGVNVALTKVSDLQYTFNYTADATSSKVENDKKVTLESIDFDISSETGVQTLTLSPASSFDFSVSKTLPTAKIENVNSLSDIVTFDLVITDADDALIDDSGSIKVLDYNGREAGTIVKFNQNDKRQTITIKGLKQGAEYEIKYLDNYNLLDQKGVQVDQEMVNAKFVNKDVGASIDEVTTSKTKTDVVVENMKLSGMALKDVKSGSVTVTSFKATKTVNLTPQQITEVKNGELVTPVALAGLASDAEYLVSVKLLDGANKQISIFDKAKHKVITNKVEPQIKDITLNKKSYYTNEDIIAFINLTSNTDKATITKIKVNGQYVNFTTNNTVSLAYSKLAPSDKKAYEEKIEEICYDENQEDNVQEKCIAVNTKADYFVKAHEATTDIKINNVTTTDVEFTLDIKDIDKVLNQSTVTVGAYNTATKTTEGTVTGFVANGTYPQQVKITGLTPGESYELQVKGDYDINDGLTHTGDIFGRLVVNTGNRINVEDSAATSVKVAENKYLTVLNNAGEDFVIQTQNKAGNNIQVTYEDYINPPVIQSIDITPDKNFKPTVSGKYTIKDNSGTIDYNGIKTGKNELVFFVLPKYDEMIDKGSYAISTPTDWMILGETSILTSDINAHLTQDLDFTNLVKPSVPKVYTGILDGQGFTINKYTSDTGGLFTHLAGTVKNLYLASPNINVSQNKDDPNGSKSVGSIANNTTGFAYIDNVGVSNLSLTKTIPTGWGTAGNGTGGMIGITTGDIYIDNSYVTGVVNNLNGSSGAVDSTTTGGIAGCLRGKKTEITNSYTNVNITGKVNGGNANSQSGGIVGYGLSDNYIVFDNVYTKGSLTNTAGANSANGGFIGEKWSQPGAKNMKISNSFAYVSDLKVTARTPQNGGLIGIDSDNNNVVFLSNVAYRVKGKENFKQIGAGNQNTNGVAKEWTSNIISKDSMEEVLSKSYYDTIKDNTTPTLLDKVTKQPMKYQTPTKFN